MINDIMDMFTLLDQRLDDNIANLPEEHLNRELNAAWVRGIASEVKVFDCSDISEQVIGDGTFESQMYPYKDTPPSIDARLPSPVVLVAFPITRKDVGDIKKGRYKGLNRIDDPELNKASAYGYKPLQKMMANIYYVCRQISDDPTHFDIYSFSSGYSPMRYGTVGGANLWELDALLKFKWQEDPEFLDAVSGGLRRVCCLLQTINTPRFVKINKDGTRQARRSAHKGMGFAVDAWHKVGWDVDRPVTARDPYDTKFHKMPLHFNRGHWKKAEKQHPKSILREGRWQTWIEGYWAGHPAFGFKKQYWTPTKKIA